MTPMERAKEILDKVPWTFVMVGLVGYFAYDGYTFVSDPGSTLNVRKGQIQVIKKDNEQTQVKLKAAYEFFKSLDAKRSELRFLATQLEEMKTTLSTTLDVPSFIKMVVTEAKKVGMRVTSLKPTEGKAGEYYFEQSFDLNFQAVYAQLLVFLDRLASAERIVRVDNFSIRRMGSSDAPFVPLNGTVQLKAYRYLGSKADEIGSSGAVQSAAPPAPAAAATPAPGGKP